MIVKNTLDAVNLILYSVGESPVNSLNSGHASAEMAETFVSSVNASVQEKGWSFNSDLNFTLKQDINGEVHLPANVLRVDTTTHYRTKTNDYVQRGQKLYDRINHTFNIGADLKVDIVLELPFEDLPDAARRYITVKAARKFQDAFLGSDTLHSFQQSDEQEAWALLRAYDLDMQDLSIFDSPDVGYVLNRRVY